MNLRSFLNADNVISLACVVPILLRTASKEVGLALPDDIYTTHAIEYFAHVSFGYLATNITYRISREFPKYINNPLSTYLAENKAWTSLVAGLTITFGYEFYQFFCENCWMGGEMELKDFAADLAGTFGAFLRQDSLRVNLSNKNTK